MGEHTSDAALSIALRGIATAEPFREQAPLEEEVVKLFDHFREHLLRYLLSIGLRVEDGEEVVQEVFLALFRHLEKDGSRKNLRGWIFQVAHNLGLKRRQRARMSTETEESQAIDPAPSPEDRLAAIERHSRLQAVLGALPEQDQQCLYLRAEGLRYREIAEVLGMSLGAVSNSLGRSLARFARADER